jgi:CheY-like chemotaxis protein
VARLDNSRQKVDAEMQSNAQQTVIVVDDDEDIRVALRDVLEAAGYQVVEATDGVEALNSLHALEFPAVVLTNHTMPRLDGPALIELLTSTPELAQRCRIVYMTAGSRVLSPHFAQLLQRHSIPHLRKPFDVDALVGTIRTAATSLNSAPLDASSDVAHE